MNKTPRSSSQKRLLSKTQIMKMIYLQSVHIIMTTLLRIGSSHHQKGYQFKFKFPHRIGNSQSKTILWVFPNNTMRILVLRLLQGRLRSKARLTLLKLHSKTSRVTSHNSNLYVYIHMIILSQTNIAKQRSHRRKSREQNEDRRQ